MDFEASLRATILLADHQPDVCLETSCLGDDSTWVIGASSSWTHLIMDSLKSVNLTLTRDRHSQVKIIELRSLILLLIK